VLDPGSLLRAGGILPEGQPVPEGERTGVVRARRYVHPALPGRPVVRLVADAMAPGADVEMQTLGFDAPAVSEPLGRQRFRALGFPGWALVNDPKRARFALEVMKDFRRAAARAKSKPGHARDAFAEIAERLARSVPHFLPSLWEEAGRAFIAEDNVPLASQAFEKARQVELEHHLDIDEAARSEAFLEFALAGAVSARSLAAYGKELQRARGAADAYPRFAELALRRTLGGVPPWANMARDLRSLAKAAGMDGDAEDERVLGELLDAPSLARAPVEFWNAYRAALVRMAQSSLAVRARLAVLFPSGGADFPSWWLDVLAEAGVLDGIGEGKRGAAAEWLARALGYAQKDARLPALLERFAPRLVADGVPLAIVHGTAWAARASLEVCERALELGVPLADPGGAPRPGHWPSPFQLQAGFACDPVRVAADPRFGPLLSAAVARAVGHAAFEKAARGKAGVLAARRAWLVEHVARLEMGVASIEATLPVVREKTTRTIFAEFPEERHRLERLSLAEGLASVLRGGLVDEYGWAAFEQAVVDLGAKDVEILGAFPYAVLCGGPRAIVVGPDGRVLEHDLRLPPGVRPLAAFHSAGQLLVAFHDRAAAAQRAYWSGRPHEVFAVSGFPAGLLRTSLVLPDGSVSLGGRKVSPGDTDFGKASGIAADAAGAWTFEQDEGHLRLREIDPETGARGRVSWPGVVERSLAPGDVVAGVELLPASKAMEGSPLAMRDGLAGAWVVRGRDAALACIGVDGRRLALPGGQQTHASPLTFPGDDRPRLAVERPLWGGGHYRRVIDLFDDALRPLGSAGKPGYARGWGVVPPLAFWHFVSPRDEAGSRALRRATAAQAEALLDAARADHAGGDATLSGTRMRVAEVLPEVTHPRLVEGVAGLAGHAAVLGEALARVIEERVAPSGSTGVSETVGETEVVGGRALHEAMPVFVGRSYGQANVAAELASVARWLDGGPVSTLTTSFVAWELWLGSTRALAFVAAGAAATDEQRDVLLRFLGAWHRAGFDRSPASLRVVTVRAPLRPSPLNPGDMKQPGWLAAEGASRYFVRRGAVDTFREMVVLSIVERTSDGTFRLPKEVTVESEWRGTGSGDEGWLEGFLAEMASRGAPAWEPRAAEAVSRRTGLSRAEGALLWAGLPWPPLGSRDFLGKERREKLGLKLAEAGVAADTLRKRGMAVYLDVFAAAAPDDPRTLWTPLGAGPEDDASPAARLSLAWTAKVGKVAAVREDLVVLCKSEIDLQLPPAVVLRALREPEDEPCMRLKAVLLKDILDGERGAGASERFGSPTLVSVALLLRFFFAALPVGDAYRSAIPRLVDVTRARLADRSLVLWLGQGWFGEENRAQAGAVVHALGGETGKVPGLGEVRDAGAVIVSLPDPARVRAVFRPAFVKSYEDDPRLGSLAKLFGTSAGAVEAAALYLQLLALPEPSTRNVTKWNGWKTADVKAAGAELMARKLVVGGKRERTGRDHFLPGGWDKAMAIEPWKLALYPRSVISRGTLLVGAPLHAVFEAAWRRIESGDRPAFEEV
jgi:hypothetical protein